MNEPVNILLNYNPIDHVYTTSNFIGLDDVWVGQGTSDAASYQLRGPEYRITTYFAPRTDMRIGNGVVIRIPIMLGLAM